MNGFFAGKCLEKCLMCDNARQRVPFFIHWVSHFWTCLGLTRSKIDLLWHKVAVNTPPRRTVKIELLKTSWFKALDLRNQFLWYFNPIWAKIDLLWYKMAANAPLQWYVKIGWLKTSCFKTLGKKNRFIWYIDIVWAKIDLSWPKTAVNDPPRCSVKVGRFQNSRYKVLNYEKPISLTFWSHLDKNWSFMAQNGSKRSTTVFCQGRTVSKFSL